MQDLLHAHGEGLLESLEEHLFHFGGEAQGGAESDAGAASVGAFQDNRLFSPIRQEHSYLHAAINRCPETQPKAYLSGSDSGFRR